MWRVAGTNTFFNLTKTMTTAINLYSEFLYGSGTFYMERSILPTANTPTGCYVLREHEHNIVTWQAPLTNTDGSVIVHVPRYVVYRSAHSNFTDIVVIADITSQDDAGNTDTCYFDAAIDPATTYYYRVAAFNDQYIISEPTAWEADTFLPKDLNYEYTSLYTSHKNNYFYKLLEDIPINHSLPIVDTEHNVVPFKNIYAWNAITQAYDIPNNQYLVAMRAADLPIFIYTAYCPDVHTVYLVFSCPLETTTATDPTNYVIDNGITVQAATLSNDGTMVTLITSQHVLSTTYTVTLNNIHSATSDYTTINTTKTYTLTNNLNITSIGAFSGQPYDEVQVIVSNDLYVDTPSPLINIPDRFAGFSWIRTADVDKTVTVPSGSHVVQFTVDQPVTVFVGYATDHALPTWLSTWTPTGITNELITGQDYTFYAQNFPIGVVTLEQNDSANHMYAIAVQNNGILPVATPLTLSVWVDGTSKGTNPLTDFFYVKLDELPYGQDITIDIRNDTGSVIYKTTHYKTYNYLIFPSALAEELRQDRLDITELQNNLYKYECSSTQLYLNFGSFLSLPQPKYLTNDQYRTMLVGDQAGIPGVFNSFLQGGTIASIKGIVKSITGAEPTIAYYRDDQGWIAYFDDTHTGQMYVLKATPTTTIGARAIAPYSKEYKAFTLRLIVSNAIRSVTREPIVSSSYVDYLDGTNIVGTVTVVDSGGVSYLEGVDYTLDAVGGVITWIGAHRPVAGQTLYVDYDFLQSDLIERMVNLAKHVQYTILIDYSALGFGWVPFGTTGFGY